MYFIGSPLFVGPHGEAEKGPERFSNTCYISANNTIAPMTNATVTNDTVRLI
jgi:hypothetical protein